MASASQRALTPRKPSISTYPRHPSRGWWTNPDAPPTDAGADQPSQPPYRKPVGQRARLEWGSPLLVACLQLQQEVAQGFGFLVVKSAEEVSLDARRGVRELVCDAASWGCKGNCSLAPVVWTRAALDQRVDGVEDGAHVARVGPDGGGEFGEWQDPALAKRQQNSVRRRS